MYLSVKSCHILDGIVKDFEVALRSYIASKLKTIFTTEDEFKNGLKNIDNSLSSSTVLLSNKFKSQVKATRKEYKTHYKALDYSYQSYIDKRINDKEVPLLSKVISYLELFYTPYFKDSDLIKGFETIEFLYHTHKFNKTRNILSHPAGWKVSNETAKEITKYIERCIKNIDGKYFWYVSQKDLIKQIENLYSSIGHIPFKYCNITSIPFKHKKIVCRENELDKLNEFIFGKSDRQYYRIARSVAICGYGGLGKTALTLEFINTFIKNCQDNPERYNYAGLLFFTAKEESLSYAKQLDSLTINPVKKQIDSFLDFKNKFYSILKISNIEDFNSEKCIVIIDNLETLPNEKDCFFDFIRNSPENIQYIITSREIERCDDIIELKGFDDLVQGEDFIKQYIDEYELDLVYKSEYIELVEASKGNTLILVLSLIRLNENPNSLSTILSELQATTTRNISAVANFMYKNTFDIAIKKIEKSGFNYKELLTIISAYDEPIDLHSLARLSNIKDVAGLEKVCEYLTNKLILTRSGDYYELNEFANRFILVKVIPDKTEAYKLYDSISKYKFDKRKKLRTLEEKRLNPNLDRIMRDWSPRNNIEKLAIADVFGLYPLAKKIGTYGYENSSIIDKIQNVFEENEQYTSHPYLKFQKALIYQIILSARFRPEYLSIVTSCYEETIFTVKFEYAYIAKTESFGVVLSFYGSFLARQFEDYAGSVRYLEESVDIFESLNISPTNDNYKRALNQLESAYHKLYKQSKDSDYRYLRDKIKEKKLNLGITVRK